MDSHPDYVLIIKKSPHRIWMLYIYSVINLLFKKRKSSRNTMLLSYNDTLFYQVKYKISLAKFSYDYENDIQKSMNINVEPHQILESFLTKECGSEIANIRDAKYQIERLE